MSDQPAAIRACFSDFRLIKGRKQAQLIFEVPIEEADAALNVLGGIPQPHSDRWVAVARLNDVAKPEPESKKGVTYGEFAQVVENAYYTTHPEEAAKRKPEPEPKEKRKWDDLKLSMQAGIRCSEPAFWKFLAKEKGFSSAVDEESTTFLVRSICGVYSRGGLNTELQAASRWRDLDRSYQAWLKVGDA